MKNFSEVPAGDPEIWTKGIVRKILVEDKKKAVDEDEIVIFLEPIEDDD